MEHCRSNKSPENQKSEMIHIIFMIILIISVSFLIFPENNINSALAENTRPYQTNCMTYYESLNDRQRQLFEYLYTNVRNNKESIDLPDQTCYDDVIAAMKCINDDCPELCNLNGKYRIIYYQEQPEIAVKIEPEYILEPENIDELITMAREITDRIQGNPLEREKQIYEYLIRNCEYSTAEKQINAYHAILQGQASCEGYARAFTIMMRISEIPCGLVTGVAYNGKTWDKHTWNIVKIDNRKYYCDLTWDDLLTGEIISSLYFNVESMNDRQEIKENQSH